MRVVLAVHRTYIHLYCVGITGFSIYVVLGQLLWSSRKSSNESNAGSYASVWRETGA